MQAYGAILGVLRVLGTPVYLGPPTETRPVGFLTTEPRQRSLPRTLDRATA